MSYENIIVETRGKVGLITLNRPKAMNALNDKLIDEISAALDGFEADPNIGCMVVTGSDKAFAAGADIGAMAGWNFMDVYKANYISRNWDRIVRCRKPIIAAVAGFALGGGCELAMACDFIYASEKAKFGQPEVKLGVIPGFGGTQRLARRVGVAKAKELCVTGDLITAGDALRIGLADLVVAPEALMPTVRELAGRIAANGPLAVAAAKRCIHRGQSMPLADALALEQREFGALFATADQKEGMTAFVGKRAAQFTGS